MKTVPVVAAIITDGRSVYATQRGHGDLAGGWEFPGGKVEPGETPEEALVREIHEELEATVEIDRYVGTIEYDYTAFHLSMRCYLVHVSSGELRLLEHSAARWVGAQDIDSVAWLPADLLVVQAIKEQGIL